jgi:hypothetical protein
VKRVALRNYVESDSSREGGCGGLGREFLWLRHGESSGTSVVGSRYKRTGGETAG